LTPEFRTEEDKGLIQEPALFEISQQRRRWLVDVPVRVISPLWQIVVVIPTWLADLDESNAGFAQSASYQALAGELIPPPRP
jgi:hypothetical protein